MTAPELVTSAGRMRGAEKDGIVRFLGVPFAAPPVGPGRWHPPAPPETRTDVLEADRFAPPAPQRGGLMARLLGLGDDPGSEDCLALNVWTPALDAGRRPILFWIHGGSFTSGSGGSLLYDGSALARRGDVVVVTVSYRLGALGYLAHPRLGDPAAPLGNRGLLDQIAALEWVRAHGAELGGDPDCVTVFGESAGAMSVGTLLATPRAHGLFHRAILQSGAAENASRISESRRVADHFIGEAGAGVEGLDVLELERILEAQERTSGALWRSLSGLAYQPVVDGELVPEAPLDAVLAARSAQVPILVGTNRDEYRLWAPTDPKAAGMDAAALERRLALHLPGADSQGRPWPARVAGLYREQRTGRLPADPASLWFAIETDRVFRARALRLAEAHAGNGGATFVYRFDWPSPALEGALGSCHALEIPFVFGTWDQPGIRDFTGQGAAVRQLSEAMQDAWLAFARHGDPRCDATPAWAAHDAETRATQVFGAERPVVSDPEPEERRLWEEVAAG